MEQTYELNKGKQCDIYGVMLSYGFSDEITSKKYGSCADIYLEKTTDYGQKFYVLIDDGNVEIQGATYHIYASENLKSKIFEGRIETKEELTTVLKVLGISSN
jgi:hypothetical protein